MTASVFSAFWYRVCGLRPRLGARLRVERHIHREETWHLLVDRKSGRSLRLNAAAYAFVARLNGARTVQQIWDHLAGSSGDDAPTQDEVIRILSQLQERHLLQAEPGSDFDAIFRQWSEQSARRTRRHLNPLALRIPLGSPDRLLAELDPLARWLFRRRVLALWAVCVAAGLAAAAVNWGALQAHAAKWMGTPYYALLALAAYPAIKAIHELAHGLAVRRWGGEVPAVGITLLVLMPVPFVDASAASAFRHARQRVAVSAAGIMAELLLACGALAVWLIVEPGPVRDVAFVVAFIGAVSTVLFNGNPLLRFDGYYVLGDALDLPNLATRSARWWAEALRRHLLRVPIDDPLPVARGERPWLAAYAPLSWAYRAVLCMALTVWAGGHSLLLGTAVGLLLGATLLMAPAAALYRQLKGPPLAPRDRSRAIATGVAVLAGLVLVLGVLPMPFGSVTQGVVWLPDEARVRAETDGFVSEIRAFDGSRVRPGDVLLVLFNPSLDAERARHAASVAALEPELYQALRSDPARAQDVREALDLARADLARTEQRIAALTVRAGAEGVLAMPRQDDLPGTFARKGTLLGHVLQDDAATIRVAVPEDEAALVGSRTRRVEARLAEEFAEALPGELIRNGGAAGAPLPSAALGVRHGGSFLTDPDDQDGLRPVAPVVLMDVRLPGVQLRHVGERAWVRFDYGAAPLAEQWLRRLRQALLRHFDPAG